MEEDPRGPRLAGTCPPDYLPTIYLPVGRQVGDSSCGIERPRRKARNLLFFHFQLQAAAFIRLP